MDKHQFINQDSGNTEWYTPPEIVEAARLVMDGIDLDPASSLRANDIIVKAQDYFSAPFMVVVDAVDGMPIMAPRYYLGGRGLHESWYGRVWLNHPFGNSELACKLPGCTKKSCEKRGWHTAEALPGNKEWINKLVSEYEKGHIEQACCITYAATSEAWFKPLKDYAMCLIDGRVNYLDPATMKPVKGVTKGSVVTYLGDAIDRFVAEYSPFGAVMVRARPARPSP